MKKNIYEKMYGNEKNSGNLAASPRIRRMVEMIDRLNLENKKILDIGCHDGSFLSLVKNQDNRFFGLDASEWAVAESRKRGISTRLYFFDGEKPLPHEDNFFDVVIAGDIIEHIFDTDFFLSEISRVLKPNGVLLISAPNLASFGRRLMLFFGSNPIIELSPSEPGSVGHIRYFTFKTLQALLKKNNFKTIFSCSDCVNFSKNGKLKSQYLARIFPRFGASVICFSRKRRSVE